MKQVSLCHFMYGLNLFFWGGDSPWHHYGSRKLCQNNYKFFFFVLRLQCWQIWGMYYTVGKVFSRPFYRYITRPQIFKILVDKTKRNMRSFSDCKAGWSNEPQWENNCGSFSQYFLRVYWRKVMHLLIIGDVCWQWLDDQSDDHLYSKSHCQSFGY